VQTTPYVLTNKSPPKTPFIIPTEKEEIKELPISSNLALTRKDKKSSIPNPAKRGEGPPGSLGIYRTGEPEKTSL